MSTKIGYWKRKEVELLSDAEISIPYFIVLNSLLGTVWE